MLTRLFLAVWRMSVYGAATALVVAAAVLLLRRLRVGRAVCCALWLVVLARLLCPVSIPSAVSIFNTPVLERCVGAAKGAEAGADVLWTAKSGAALPGGLRPDAAAGAAADHAPVQPGQAAAQPERGASGGLAGSGAADAGQPGAGLALLAAVWLAGAAAMAVYGLWGAARLRRQVAFAFKVEGEPGVFAAEQVAEPFAFGLLRPRIYLPLGLESEERRIILLHERAHLRRRDNLVKPLFYAALCLHWFNPLAWLAFKGMACDMEAACDEAVLRAAGSGVKAAYCESLLRFSGPQKRAMTALSFGEGRVAGRVRAVLRYRRPGFWAALAAALAAAALAAACMADPAGAADGPDAESGAAGSVAAGSTPARSALANSAPAGGVFAESAPAELPAGGVLAQSGAAASVPALEGEEMPLVYSEDGEWLWPAPQYTSWQEDVTGGSRIFAPKGSVLLAMADGEIAESEAGIEWNRIELRRTDGSTVRYYGPLTPLVSEGDEVSQGQVIATLGPGTEPEGLYFLLELFLVDHLSAGEPAIVSYPRLLFDEGLIEPEMSDWRREQQNVQSDPGRLSWPVPGYSHVSRWMDSQHKGADLVAEAGTPIFAAADGEVISAFYHYSYGNFVVIDHGDGWRSLYAHCSELLVSEGDTVKRGQEIARVGATGSVTGNICHFELYCGGALMDAKDYFPAAENGGPVPDYQPQV